MTALPSVTFDARDRGAMRLTGRQTEVLRLIAQGLRNKEIAFELRVAESTVKWHVTQMIRALAVRNRAELVGRAAGLGYLY